MNLGNFPINPDQVVAIAEALDVDPESVRADTPLASLGWTGSAGEWAIVSDRLGAPMLDDPPIAPEATTIAELVAIVENASTPVADPSGRSPKRIIRGRREDG